MSDETTENKGPAGLTHVGEVSVSGPGVSITRPVDEATMSSVVALLFGVAPATPSGRGGGGGGTGGGGGGNGGGRAQPPAQWDEELTLGEFITETGASTFQQKICAAGYYLMNFQGRPSFSREDVRTALADAHEDMPGNFGRDFTAAAGKNLVSGKTGESGQYIVPRTGKKAVESNFQEVPKRKPARKTAKKASVKGDAE